MGQGHLQRKREVQLKGGPSSQRLKNPTSLPPTQKTTTELSQFPVNALAVSPPEGRKGSITLTYLAHC